MRSAAIAAVAAFAVSASPAAAATFEHAGRYTPTRAAATPYTLIQLTQPGAALSPDLRGAGARLVAPGLDVWRVRSSRAGAVARALARDGSLGAVEPDQRLVEFNHLSAGDPLIPSEWWIPAIGADRVEPPGPGVPVTVVDTGVDMTHPEFASRPSTILLNRQSIDGPEDVHGTMVSSVVGAPANGIGIVGVYPRATLQEWDFGGASLGEVLASLDAATRRGRSVVNMSGGFFTYSALLERAVDRAVSRGVLVVAAVGNEREKGNTEAFPATLPHVLTVAATNEASRVASFSTRSSANDLAAPGQNIPVAVPTASNASGYSVEDGTSFSAPLVAGAAAWVWTQRPTLDVTQIADVMRDSARDVGAKGWDADTGFGILDIPNALAVPARPPDPGEPNDDVNVVRPFSLTTAGEPPLVGPKARAGTIRASVDAVKDPDDVYRVWLPAGGRIYARLHGTANVDLALWGPRTHTIFERGAAAHRDLLSFSQRPGRATDVVHARSKWRRGVYAYLDVFPGRHVSSAYYTLSVATSLR